MICPAKVSRSTMAAEARVAEGPGPAGERLVRGDGDCRARFSLGEYLELQFGAAAVEFHVTQLIRAACWASQTFQVRGRGSGPRVVAACEVREVDGHRQHASRSGRSAGGAIGAGAMISHRVMTVCATSW